MKAFRSVTVGAAVLDRPDVDTDQIIPKQFLKRIERTGYGEFLFYDWRQGSRLRAEPPEATRARGSCSPDRTSAAARRASTRRGRFRTTDSSVVIAPSFGDIFFANSVQIGLVPATLPGRTRSRRSWPRSGDGGELTVDLETQTIVDPSVAVSSHSRSTRSSRTCLLNGLDSDRAHVAARERHHSVRGAARRRRVTTTRALGRTTPPSAEASRCRPRSGAARSGTAREAPPHPSARATCVHQRSSSW